MLAGYLPQDEWEKFLDKLDIDLEPAQAIKALTYKLVIGALVFVVLLFVWGAIAYTNFDYSDWNSDNFYIFFFIAFGIAVLVPLFSRVKISKVANAVKNKMKRTCDEYSNEYPLLAFQIKFDSVLIGGGGGDRGDHQYKTFNYIGIEMAPNAVPTAPVAGQFTGIPMMGMGPGGTGIGIMTPGVVTGPAPAPPADTGDGKSAAVRLQELNQLKELLSEEEYAEKKQQILDSV